MMENKKNPSILGTNILYLIIALLLITLGAKAQYREVYTGLLITEYVIVLMPTLLYLKLNGYSIKDVLRLNRITLKQTIYIIFIVMFSYPVAIFFNFVGIMILSKFGQIAPNAVPIPASSNEFLLSFFIIALTPGICEEAMFRGLVMNSYESLGRRKAVIYSAILFGMFHFNVQNLLGPIFLGIIFGIIALKTDSLFSTILGHTINNAIALIIGYKLVGLEDLQGVSYTVDLMPESSLMVYTFIALGILALIFGLLLYKLIKSLPGSRKKSVEIDNAYREILLRTRNKKLKMNWLERIPIGIFMLIFILWNYKFFFS
ncbi:putative Abortive infection protein [[Clostridium] ultunense Esp]|uniref:Putative Abortive infection protein n=1 Tax=[Clostridium] ultunense Esp TaxID=1288971 RepID=M1Z6W4_9FIRM|nr:CPBP family intramembrane glutamic endopeptidase [Schnuerera ultunensis]CCQ98570.1 putative Abortive infection protein [[Clostridium] ultunense Esp]SHD78565.1 putative Abortive infection protein [[Clostridium] ultunense Esp]